MTNTSRLLMPFGRAISGAALVAALMGTAAQAQNAQQPAQRPAQAQPAQRPAAPAQPPAQQPAAPAAPAAPGAAAAPAGPPPEWMKVCAKDDKQNADVCSTSNYILAEAGNVVGEVRVFEVKQGKETKRVFEALIPPGFLIQPGVNLVVDDEKKPTAGRYRVCFPNLCLTEVPLTEDVIGKFKKGKELTLFAANPQGQWVGAKVTLAGFGKAYDGPAMDPKAFEEKRKTFDESQSKLQAELMKRAEEQRKKLQEGGAAAPAPGAPAPAAPAAPKP